MTKQFKAFAPDGAEIIATLDRIYGHALIDSFELDEYGNHSPIYTGQTNVIWDSQAVEEIDGQSIYVDENWQEWPENKLVFKPTAPPRIPAPTAEQLSVAHGKWGEHPRYPASGWANEACTNETRLGYWEWVSLKLEIDLEDTKDDA